MKSVCASLCLLPRKEWSVMMEKQAGRCCRVGDGIGAAEDKGPDRGKKRKKDQRKRKEDDRMVMVMVIMA
ncbi:hypothetical protein CDL15_Pgr011701 [Punica granatum]|uniref:Uncharacterized protein n=2 Tax=Punica granatum TaxID=22663 RepID=A0A218WWI6_PUNGR|nr:hypothetical protein CDL15_Pgr011701 [Punica granatum]